MRTIATENFRILVNKAVGWSSDTLFTRQAAAKALRFHKSLRSYQPTKLISLSKTAKEYHVGAILVKDESTRFGLKAFKGLGGSYAIFRSLCERLGLDDSTAVFEDFQNADIRKKCGEIEFVTATDGNHGKGVAWAAGLFGCRSHVFMPKGSVEARRQAIEAAGASSAVITDGNYDETVAYAGNLAAEKGWILVQDTAWEGYEETPRHIVEGYLTMAEEICDQTGGKAPTHIFLQAGVGAMAGGIAGYFLNRFRDAPPYIAIVEPSTVACITLSAEIADGKMHSIEGNPVTIMAGLNCGTPCSVTWPVLRDGVSFYCACDDCVTEQGIQSYAHPLPGDPSIISGESGAVPYGLLLHILKDGKLRELMKIDEHSVVLLINSEGDTDPEGYRRIVHQK